MGMLTETNGRDGEAEEIQNTLLGDVREAA
jgi:hypothetical protein